MAMVVDVGRWVLERRKGQKEEEGEKDSFTFFSSILLPRRSLFPSFPKLGPLFFLAGGIGIFHTEKWASHFFCA